MFNKKNTLFYPFNKFNVFLAISLKQFSEIACQFKEILHHFFLCVYNFFAYFYKCLSCVDFVVLPFSQTQNLNHLDENICNDHLSKEGNKQIISVFIE